MRKSKYTNSQRKAYYSGMGYCAGQKGKVIPFKSEQNKRSFYAGYIAGRTKVEKYSNVTKS